jgi:hypothetical protein
MYISSKDDEFTQILNENWTVKKTLTDGMHVIDGNLKFTNLKKSFKKKKKKAKRKTRNKPFKICRFQDLQL